jgi:hypothetical protein
MIMVLNRTSIVLYSVVCEYIYTHQVHQVRTSVPTLSVIRADGKAIFCSFCSKSIYILRIFRILRVRILNY